jgi:hypothetical protein
MAITSPNMATTIKSSKNTTRKNMYLTLEPMYLTVICAMDLPWFRMEMTSAPKSCTAPITIDPRNTHIIAGSHPQIIPMAGPTIGPVPAIEV